MIDEVSHFDAFNVKCVPFNLFMTVSTNRICSSSSSFDYLKTETIFCFVWGTIHRRVELCQHVGQTIKINQKAVLPGSVSPNEVKLTWIGSFCS